MGRGGDVRAPLATDVEIAAGGARLGGVLALPPHARGVVVFAHGSGSGRLSPRNAAVAGTLNGSGLATLLFDLLRDDESRDRARVFDIALLAERLDSATDWVRREDRLASLPVGYFGASTGAAAALVAAAERGDVGAIVSRGGRPDLADARLERVRVPTLLIVGGADVGVLELNRLAQARLGGPSELATVLGATHLFEERGALEEVAALARDWVLGQLPGSGAAT